MKILCLCSGGFDSVVMLHKVREENPDSEIGTLFFNYGQKNAEYEKRCAMRVSDKLKCLFQEIVLPKFTWSSSEFYSPKFSEDKEYLEMRNLIFISYALSFCESKDYKTLYMATLKSHGYYDTSENFLSKVKGIAQDKGISLETPFSEVEKTQLCYLSYKYRITESDFFTCDNPVNGSPCGECPDCLVLKSILEYVPLPVERFLDNFDCTDPIFQDLVKKSPITEMRVYTNHLCQLSCKHCYYGYEELHSAPLSLDEFRGAFAQARDLGINDFHFSGKEPLYDDSVFDVIKVLKEVHQNASVSFVTNGINIPRYADKLIAVKPTKVCLSVDDVLDLQGVRTVKKVTDRALSCLRDSVPIEVFIDLHENNYNKVGDIISHLFKSYKVTNFYIRTINPIGSAQNMKLLTEKELNDSYLSIREVCRSNTSLNCMLVLMIAYSYKVLAFEYLPLSQALKRTMENQTLEVERGLQVCGELFCSSFHNQITLTSDGYVQGCASESCFKEYYKNSAGNIRLHSLKELICRGKEHSLESGNYSVNNLTCSCRNPLF